MKSILPVRGIVFQRLLSPAWKQAGVWSRLVYLPMLQAPVEFENLLYEVRDRVAVVTVNRPDKLNALNRATVEEAVAAAGSTPLVTFGMTWAEVPV